MSTLDTLTAEELAEVFEGCEFYALKTRTNGPLSGRILIAFRGRTNGQSFAAMAMPKNPHVAALPCVTWTHDDDLLPRSVKITLADALVMDRAMISAIVSHHLCAEYRTMYEAEIRKAGRSPLQRAFPEQEPNGVRGTCADLFYKYA